MRKRRPRLGRVTAGALIFDPEIRRAAFHAGPPVGRLHLTIGKRLVQRETQYRLDQAGQAFGTLASMLTTAGPQLAEQLGLAEHLGLAKAPRHRRVVPAAIATTAFVVAIVLVTDPHQRQRVQRLIVH